MIHRNDKCWCGSGKKYKKCHMDFDAIYEKLKENGELLPPKSLIKNEEQIEGIKVSAEVNNGALDAVAAQIKAGMSTEDINTIIHNYTVEHGAIPAPLNYGGFPKSVCTSVNNEVCHGIPDENIILKEGDIVNVDVSTIKNGYFSDASRMFKIGKVSEAADRIVDVAKECLEEGIKAVKPWCHLGDIGAAVQAHAEKNGYSVVRAFGGHGIGLEFHEDPFVAHVGKKGHGMILTPGMVFTIEPMINEGEYDVYVDDVNEWTVYTADDSLSAQWEHQLLVTETGIEIISE